jgi:hypothetical protein
LSINGIVASIIPDEITPEINPNFHIVCFILVLPAVKYAATLSRSTLLVSSSFRMILLKTRKITPSHDAV